MRKSWRKCFLFMKFFFCQTAAALSGVFQRNLRRNSDGQSLAIIMVGSSNHMGLRGATSFFTPIDGSLEKCMSKTGLVQVETALEFVFSFLLCVRWHDNQLSSAIWNPSLLPWQRRIFPLQENTSFKSLFLSVNKKHHFIGVQWLCTFVPISRHIFLPIIWLQHQNSTPR